jgi:hypothetical protein
MKKFAFFYLALCLIIWSPSAGQKSGFLNKVSKSANSILGKPEKADNTADEKVEPEPLCASDQATVAMDLGGKLQLDYKELSFSILSDGRILARAHGTDEYYVSKGGVTSGPYKEGDSQITDFVPKEENKDDKSDAAFLAKNKPYITKSGEKYLITFAGKKYGPYARIDNFTVSRSKDKFVALATETIIVTEDQSKKMEDAMKNAKTDQERMDLAMEYAQQMQQAMSDGGGPESIQAKFVTNIPNAKYDMLKSGGGSFNNTMKYDDILILAYDKIIDLQMRTVLTLTGEAIGSRDLFVNTDNTRYAFYNSGTLNFSDNTKLPGLFNPQLVKVDGKVYISYMYFSPKNKAIMQHKIPF